MLGERAAAIYSLIGTAKLNRIDTEDCLRHTLSLSILACMYYVSRSSILGMAKPA